MTTKRPLGRPPATTSDATRARLLRAARDAFGRAGYAKTTNKDIAGPAGITSGAIYHYFPSKQALFAAVTDEVSRQIFDEFEAVAAEHERFVDKFVAILDAASTLHENDHSLAQFSAIFPIELQRHAELAAAVTPETVTRASSFFRELAKVAAEQNELPEGLSIADMANMLLSITIGLAQFGTLTESSQVHRGAMLAVEHVFERAFDRARRTRRKSRTA